MVTLSELTVVGTQVYRLSADHFAEPAMYVYNTTKIPPEIRAQFTLNPITGGLTLSDVKLDYEKIKEYNLVFYAINLRNPLLRSNEFRLNVIILDVNDKAPVFNSTNYVFSVAENSPIKTFIGTIHAEDADGTKANSNITYSLLNQDLAILFAVDPYDGRITIRSNLDREIRDEYRLTVQATDNSKVTACALVKITVTDVNEDVPRFPEPSYTIQMSRMTAVGYELFYFRAIDVDKTRVFYEFDTSAGKTPASEQQKFALNRTTGVLTLKSLLQKDTQKTYTVYVSGIDSVSGIPGPSTKLEMNIMDTQESRPTFAKQLYKFTVPENKPVGTDIGSVSAQSSFAGGSVLYYILENQFSKTISIGASTGVITLHEPLDYETAVSKEFIVNVCANDTTTAASGMLSLISIVFFFISLHLLLTLLGN